MLLKLFFDKDIIIEEVNGKGFVYSHINHKWFKANKSVLNLVKRIIRDDGMVNIDKLIKIFNDKCTAKLHSYKIRKLLDTLVKTEVFFFSKSSFNASIKTAIESYKIPKDQNIEIAYLHLTHRCNFNCWYCYNKEIRNDKREELNTREWIEIIERLKSKRTKKFVFTGGEPLIRSDLFEILSKTKENEIEFELLTNGSLFNKENFRKLNSVVDKFIISFDSFKKEIQAKNRSIIGFKNILNTLDLFSQYSPEKLEVRSVVTKNNVDEIDKNRKKLKENYGIINYRTILFLPNSFEEIKFMPKMGEESEIKDTLTLDYRQSYMKFRCGASTNIVAVDCRGDMFPCQSFIKEKRFKICNLLEDDWSQKHLSSRIREIFRNLSVDNMNVCKNCPYRYFCGGGCPAISWNVYGNLDTHLAFMCNYLKNEARRRLICTKTIPLLREKN